MRLGHTQRDGALSDFRTKTSRGCSSRRIGCLRGVGLSTGSVHHSSAPVNRDLPASCVSAHPADDPIDITHRHTPRKLPSFHISPDPSKAPRYRERDVASAKAAPGFGQPKSTRPCAGAPGGPGVVAALLSERDHMRPCAGSGGGGFLPCKAATVGRALPGRVAALHRERHHIRWCGDKPIRPCVQSTANIVPLDVMNRISPLRFVEHVRTPFAFRPHRPLMLRLAVHRLRRLARARPTTVFPAATGPSMVMIFR